jgi:predicted AAA+ superfamily ATPase
MRGLISRKNHIQQLEKLKDEHIVKVVTGLRRSGKSTMKLRCHKAFYCEIRALTFKICTFNTCITPLSKKIFDKGIISRI